MNRVIILLLGLVFVAGMASGQNPVDTGHTVVPADTVAQSDTTAQKDSLLIPVAITADTVQPKIKWNDDIAPVHPYAMTSGNWQLIQPRLSFPEKKSAQQQALAGDVRKVKGKELLFYLLIFLLFIFAVLRQAFPKYFSDLFRLFFKTTLKQRQIREQLMQTPLPSLLLNGFFVISGGLYLAFVLQHFSIDPLGNFWLVFLYCAMGLSVAYFVKFAGLKICGWLFNIDEAADSYIFIVFIVNKMIGIMLLPFLLILAFSPGEVYTTGLTLSWCLIGGLLIYRFILTYSAIHNQVKLNPFHFFLYLCAFEIAPLLLVYKALIIFFNQTA